jgi:DNA-binding response OmpR family regulator
LDHHISIVILEDEAFVALDLEEVLGDAGFKVDGIFSSCAAALEWFERNSPDVVVMDIELADGDCVKIATLLEVRGIPFVVHSASFASSGFHDPVFLHGVWVTKPASPCELRNAVQTALTMAGDDDVSRPIQALRS